HCATQSFAGDYRLWEFHQLLSFLTVILGGPLSHLHSQRNPRSKLSVAAEPRWVIRAYHRKIGILPVSADGHLARRSRQAGSQSSETAWKAILRKQKCRGQNLRLRRSRAGLSAVKPSHSRNWFAHNKVDSCGR